MKSPAAAKIKQNKTKIPYTVKKNTMKLPIILSPIEHLEKILAIRSCLD